VRGSVPEPERDRARQRELVDAFLAAARDGDFDRLVAILHPDAVLRADRGPAGVELHGAGQVAARVLSFARLAGWARPALVNGAAGFVVAPEGRLFAVAGFTVAEGRIVEIDLLADPERLRDLELDILDDRLE